MGQRTTVEPLSFPTDARGLVLEPVGPAALPGQQNVHLVLTEPGGIRGNHYHERGTEIAVVLGPALVRIKEDGQVLDIAIAAGQAYRLTFPPGASHAFQNPGPGTMVLVAFNTVVHDPARPDVVRDVLIEA